MRDGAPELLSSLLGALDPELRASAVFALGCLIHSQPRVGPGATPLAGARYSQPGLSGHSSSSASLAAQSLGLGGHGSSAAINVGGGAAGGGLPPSGSTASLGGADLGGAAMSPAAIEAAIAGEQSIAALLLRANVSGPTLDVFVGAAWEAPRRSSPRAHGGPHFINRSPRPPLPPGRVRR